MVEGIKHSSCYNCTVLYCATTIEGISFNYLTTPCKPRQGYIQSIYISSLGHILWKIIWWCSGNNFAPPHPCVQGSLYLLSLYAPRSSDPFYIASYYIKWVTTSWETIEERFNQFLCCTLAILFCATLIEHTVCPGSSDPFYIVSHYIKWVTTSWTHSTSISAGTRRGT